MFSKSVRSFPAWNRIRRWQGHHFVPSNNACRLLNALQPRHSLDPSILIFVYSHLDFANDTLLYSVMTQQLVP